MRFSNKKKLNIINQQKMSYETQNQIKRLNFDEINDTWNKKYEWGGTTSSQSGGGEAACFALMDTHWAKKS